MAAVGQRTWAGFAKQSSFSTFVPPTIFQGISSFSPVDKIAYIERPAARGIAGRVVSAAGPFSFAGSFKAAPDPGAVDQLVALALGNQTAPALVPTTNSVTTGAVTATGSQTVGITAGSGSLFTIGSSVYFDYGGNQETVVITGKTANSITAVFASVHPTGAIVANIATSATQSTYSMGAGRMPPYLSMQQNRDSDVLDRAGLAIDTMKIQVDMGGKLVDFDFGLVGCAALPVTDSSPATPAFATTLPFTSELALATYTGAAGATQLGSSLAVVPLQSLAITLNNNLDKNYRTVGSQFPQGFPRGTTMVSAVMKTGFENDQEFLDFLAQGTVALALKLTSQTIIETDGSVVTPYSMTFSMPKCRIMQDVVSQKTSGPLDQTVTLECYGSSIGANDDLSVYCVNTATAIY